MTITPAILPENFEQIVHKLFLLEGVASRVQIDICDGVFGLEKTWLPYQEESLPVGFEYEFDVMVINWQKYIPRVITLGATRIIAHIDTFTDADIEELLTMFEGSSLKLGLSVSNDKDIQHFAKVVQKISSKYSKVFIQVMGIAKIGAQGQPFDENVVQRIAYLKKECRNIEIQVDGSMNPETMLKVKNAGASCAVIGSYLFKTDDVKGRVETLRENFR